MFFVLLLGVGAAGARGQAPPGSDIYLVRLERSAGLYRLAGAPANITATPGYDNQPSFEPDRNGLLFTSARDGDTDIYRYDLGAGTTSRLTDTPENEYSPTVTPDRRGFTVIRGQQQFLERFDRRGRRPVILFRNIVPVGYHVWADDETLILFVLGDPPTLRRANRRTGQADTVFTNPGRSLHRIPKRRAVSAVHKRGEKDWWIVAYDARAGTVTPIVKTLDGSEDHAWTPDGVLVMASGTTLHQFDPARDSAWRELASLDRGFGRITRLAVSPDGKRLAFVADEPPR